MADPVTFAQKFQKQQGISEPYRVVIQSLREGPPQENISIKAWLPEEITFDISAQYEAPFAQGFNASMPGFGQMARAFGVNLVTQAMTAQIWQGSSEMNISIPLIFQAESNAYLDVIKPIKDLLKLTMPRDSEAGGGGLFTAPGPHIDITKLRKKLTDIDSTTTPAQQAEQGVLDKTFAAATSLFNSTVSGAKTTAGVLVNVYNEPLSTTFLKASSAVAESSYKAAAAGSVALNKTLVNSIVDNISLYIGNFLYIPSIVVTDVSQAFNIMIAPDGNPSRATVNVTFKMFYTPTQADLDTMFSASGGQDTSVGSNITAISPM
jgi:hypothetical protein